MSKDIEEIKEKIVPLLKANNVTKAGIFGSYARGEQHSKSDIDLLVEINDDRGLIEFISLKLMIEKELGKKIDLVEYDTIRKELKERILSEEIPLIR